MEYEAQDSWEKRGWCVYIKEHEDDIFVTFYSGPFQSEAVAHSEAVRKNKEIKDNG